MIRGWRDIPGWLSDAEAAVLSDLASAVPAGRTIVELGSYLGRSTVVLALGARGGGGARVYAVDRFSAEPGTEYDHWQGRPIDRRAMLEANVDALGLADAVTAVRGETAEASLPGPAAGLPVGLLYVDAGHGYEEVAADVAAWLPRCGPGATVAFHDYTNRGVPGVRRRVDELVAEGRLDGLNTADGLAWSIITPRGEHSMSADTDTSSGDFLQALGTDARKWADAFMQIGPTVDRETMTGWFANAIMVGVDHGVSRMTAEYGRATFGPQPVITPGGDTP